MPIPPNWSSDLRKFVESWDSRSADYLGDAPFDKFVLTEPAASWDEFLVWVNELQGSWCFRGQRDAGWYLNTSLDRARKRYDSSGYDHLPRESESSELLFRFQQQAHQYIPELPSSEDLSSWFAVMQHHGVPTMFLDWTKSAYVAMYFALEEEPPQDGCALWAIDLEWLEKKARELLLSEGLGDLKAQAEYLNGLLRHTGGHTGKPVILQVNPSRLDARMVAQQGFFLCTVHQAFFSQILMSMMTHPETSDGPDTPDRPVVRRLVLKSDLRIRFLKNLREMNIHRASLFPGLDGFCQSLRLDLEMKVRT